MSKIAGFTTAQLCDLMSEGLDRLIAHSDREHVERFWKPGIIDTDKPSADFALGLADGLIGFDSEDRDTKRFWAPEALFVATLLHPFLAMEALGWTAMGCRFWRMDDLQVIVQPAFGESTAYYLPRCREISDRRLKPRSIARRLGCTLRAAIEMDDITVVYTDQEWPFCAVTCDGTVLLTWGTPMAEPGETAELLGMIVEE
jgi:hypothetical protein